MSKPTRSDGHVNRPLTNISVAFMQNAFNFVASRVFPSVPVQKQSDQYFTYPRGSFNRDEMQKRAPNAKAVRGGYEIATDNYSCDVFALEKAIGDQLRANADAPINLEREAVEWLTRAALIRREKQFVADYFTAGAPGDTWTFDVDGVANGNETAAGSFDPTDASNNDVVQWSDFTNSDPLEDVATGKEKVLESTGFDPNKLVIGQPVWTKLRNHPDIVDRIKYSGQVGPDRPARVTLEAVAALMEVDEILVMKAVENTADEGQTAVHSFIGGKHALLAYAAPSPGLMTPSAGYTFNWTGLIGSGPEGNRILRYRDEPHLDVIEIEAAFDLKRVSEDLGYFFGNIVA